MRGGICIVLVFLLSASAFAESDLDRCKRLMAKVRGPVSVYLLGENHTHTPDILAYQALFPLAQAGKILVGFEGVARGVQREYVDDPLTGKILKFPRSNVFGIETPVYHLIALIGSYVMAQYRPTPTEISESYRILLVEMAASQEASDLWKEFVQVELPHMPPEIQNIMMDFQVALDFLRPDPNAKLVRPVNFAVASFRDLPLFQQLIMSFHGFLTSKFPELMSNVDDDLLKGAAISPVHFAVFQNRNLLKFGRDERNQIFVENSLPLLAESIEIERPLVLRVGHAHNPGMRKIYHKLFGNKIRVPGFMSLTEKPKLTEEDKIRKALDPKESDPVIKLLKLIRERATHQSVHYFMKAVVAKMNETNVSHQGSFSKETLETQIPIENRLIEDLTQKINELSEKLNIP